MKTFVQTGHTWHYNTAHAPFILLRLQTHRMCNICCFYTATMVRRTLLSVTILRFLFQLLLKRSITFGLHSPYCSYWTLILVAPHQLTSFKSSLKSCCASLEFPSFFYNMGRILQARRIPLFMSIRYWMCGDRHRSAC